MKNKILILMVAILFSFTFVSAVELQPQQQTNKIYLSPFYLASTISNTNYTFSLKLNPLEKIGSVQSAIITFDMWINPTIIVNLWINEKSCNNPSYTISTTYSGAGRGVVTFDCSNIITKEGNYTITLKTNKDTGALTSWIDLTYTNKPKGDLEISGTEYSPNDKATIFLQLKDEQGLAINNGACYVTIWQPNSYNSSHPIMIKDAPMLLATGGEGVYFYDLIAPNYLGIYMLSAKCSYSLDGFFVYSLDGTEIYFPSRTSVSGTYTGSPIFLNDFEDWIYTQCASSSGGTKSCEAYYDFNTTIHISNLTNITNIDLYYMGEASAKAVQTFQVWNWSSSLWINLPNNLTFTAGSTSPLGIGDYSSNLLPINNVFSSSGIIRIKTLSSFGSTYNQFDNWLNLNIKTATGTIVDVKGSGEMHITDLANATINAIINNSEIAGNVWNYPIRNLTYHPLVTNVTLNPMEYENISQATWDYNSTINSNLLLQIESAVWSFTNTIVTQILSQFSSSIWSYPSRNLTNYPIPIDTTNYTLISDEIWNYSYRYTHGEII